MGEAIQFYLGAKLLSKLNSCCCYQRGRLGAISRSEIKSVSKFKSLILKRITLRNRSLAMFLWPGITTSPPWIFVRKQDVRTGSCAGRCTGSCSGSCTGCRAGSCTGSCAWSCTGSCAGSYAGRHGNRTCRSFGHAGCRARPARGSRCRPCYGCASSISSPGRNLPGCRST